MRSLRGRVTLLVLLAVAAAMTVSSVVIVAGAYRDDRRKVDVDLETRAASVLGLRSLPGRAEGPQPFQIKGAARKGLALAKLKALAAQPVTAPAAQQLLTGSGTFTRVYLGGQTVKAAGDAAAASLPAPTRPGLQTESADGRTWRTLTVASPGGMIQLGERLDSALAGAARTRRATILIGLAIVLVTGALVWLLAGLALRPLRRLREGAERVTSAHDPGARLADDAGVEEVAVLAGALNEMLVRLQESAAATERALQATRRFAGDTGHELRTPLTTIQAGVEVVLRNPDIPADERERILAEVAAEQRRLVALLDALQALARGEAAPGSASEPVDLPELLEAAVAAARSRHPQLDVRLSDCPERLERCAWEPGLRILVDNLLENAAVHAGPHAHVEVSLLERGEQLELVVDDDGPGVPAGERTGVFERFARGSSPARGSGLGLALVAQQAAVHGGAARITDAPLGGARVVVTLRLGRAGALLAATR